MNWIEDYVKKAIIKNGNSWYGSCESFAVLMETLNPYNKYPKVSLTDVIRDLIEQVEDKTMPSIKRVIFNDSATIIIWNDNTKTVVKCQSGDLYDPEKGFVMAYLKRLLGNKNEFNKEINKWVYGKKR